MAQDYTPKGVQFFYIYKALAHPENNGYITPFNLKERLMHVAEAKRTLGSQIPWICDTMDNDLKHALGDRPNSEYIIDPAGKVIVSRQWSRPDELRSDLARLVGEVDPPTQVADLKMKKLPPITKPKTGVVKRLELPANMSPLTIEPIETPGTPHYAKLRVESSGEKLYLGFFLDPLYKVHWNNKAPQLEYSIEVPDGLTLTPSQGKAPKVSVDADTDPREFLLDASGHTDGTLKVTVKYFACDDAETFCKPVTQQYIVSQERDPDGGSRRSSSGRGSRRQNQRGNPQGDRPPMRS
ncbi:MAG: hypothetical protein HKN47_27300, partial [Pirellulaceae bacterium]|nr:hypothetical protein [Pirellulaceae bacterium]